MLTRVVGVLVWLVVLIASACQSSAVSEAPTDNASLAARPNAPTNTVVTVTPGQPPKATASPVPSPTIATTERATSLSAATSTVANGAAAFSATSAGAHQSRVDLLKMADAVYASHDLARAQTLYGRVISSSPDASESTAQTRALTGFAEFRLLLTLLSAGNEERAQQLLVRLRSGNADSPFTRLANDFWDEYGMTASVQAACNAIAHEVTVQADSAVAELQARGVSIGTRQLCMPPGD